MNRFISLTQLNYETFVQLREFGESDLEYPYKQDT